MSFSSPSAPIQLRELAYELLPTPFRRPGDAAAERCRELARRIGNSAARFLDGRLPDQYMIGVTLNSQLRSDPLAGRDAHHADITAAAGLAPSMSVNMYECTNWAFLLRYAIKKARAEQRRQHVLVQVADADVHGIKAAWSTKTYGEARFGILCLLLDIDPGACEESIDIGVAPIARSMLKFGALLRRAGQQFPGIDIAAPFFPDEVSHAFRRSLPGLNVLPERHPQYGHCFGADPWIALGHDWLARPAPRDYTMASLALSGYYATARVHVPAGARIRVEAP